MINDIRGDGVIVLSVSTLSALLKVVSAFTSMRRSHLWQPCPICVPPQATAGSPFAHETDAASIQPPSSSWFGIPKNSPFLKKSATHTHEPKENRSRDAADRQTRKPHV